MQRFTAVTLGASLLALSSIAAASVSGPSPSDNRDVQIRTVDFDAGTIELFNFGCADIALDGWRFCSHDATLSRIYSQTSAFTGVTIEVGTSVTVHLNNDAPSGDPDRLNGSLFGGRGFALPLDQDAYGLQIYFPNAAGFVSFGDSSLIADHLQWNAAGSPAGNSIFRTNQAVSTGLWSAANDFIATATSTSRIVLDDATNGRLHGSADYSAVECAIDLGLGGPGAAVLSACGGFATGQSASLDVTGAPASTAAAYIVGLQSNPVPVFGGMLIPVPQLFSASFATDASGANSIAFNGGGGPVSLVIQAIYLDAAQPFSLGFTNGIRVDLQQ